METNTNERGAIKKTLEGLGNDSDELTLRKLRDIPNADGFPDTIIDDLPEINPELLDEAYKIPNHSGSNRARLDEDSVMPARTINNIKTDHNVIHKILDGKDATLQNIDTPSAWNPSVRAQEEAKNANVGQTKVTWQDGKMKVEKPKVSFLKRLFG